MGETNFKELALGLLDSSPLNPREDKKAGLNSLVRSIQTTSLLHHPVVRPKGDRYEVICGERRVEALRKLGETAVVCKVVAMTDPQAAAAISIENGLRRDLRDIELAKLIHNYMELVVADTGKRPTQVAVAELLGLHPQKVLDCLKLLNLVDSVAEKVAKPSYGKKPPEGQLSGFAATQIAQLPPAMQPEAAKQVLTEDLTGKETRKLVMKLKKRTKLVGKNKVPLPKDLPAPLRAPKDIAKMIPKIKPKAPPGPTPSTIKEVIKDTIAEVKAPPTIQKGEVVLSPILERCPKLGSQEFQAVLPTICVNAFNTEVTIRRVHPDVLLAEILAQRYKINQKEW